MAGSGLRRRHARGQEAAARARAPGASQIRPGTSQARPGVGGHPVPAAFKAQPITWTTSRDGWVLGTVPCRVVYGPVNFSDLGVVYRTAGGGRSWHAFGFAEPG